MKVQCDRTTPAPAIEESYYIRCSDPRDGKRDSLPTVVQCEGGLAQNSRFRLMSAASLNAADEEATRGT